MQKVLEHEFGQEEGGNGMELYFCVSERVDGKVRTLFCLVIVLHGGRCPIKPLHWFGL